ncbi:MAG: PAS domain-containing protein [Flavobacteriales bacterium]|nr:PAS domain-containing protein [Flavobacteriales bacterium]
MREAERLAKIGSWDLDLVNNNLVWSDEIYRIFDTAPQSFGATYDAFLNFIHPEDRDFVDDIYRKSVEIKEPYGPITHRLVMKSANLKFVEERGVTVYTDGGTPLRSYGTCQDITDRVVGEKTKAQLKEKEVLLKEIYHRVKNNLQLISSLLNIQASKIDDKEIRSIFETNQMRINAIALVHDQLCRSDNLATVQANEFITNLIDNYKDSTFLKLRRLLSI